MNSVKIIDGLPNTTKVFIDGVEIHGIVRYQISNGVNEPRVLKLEMLVDNVEVETVGEPEMMARKFKEYADVLNRDFVRRGATQFN